MRDAGTQSAVLCKIPRNGFFPCSAKNLRATFVCHQFGFDEEKTLIDTQSLLGFCPRIPRVSTANGGHAGLGCEAQRIVAINLPGLSSYLLKPDTVLGVNRKPGVFVNRVPSDAVREIFFNRALGNGL